MKETYTGEFKIKNEVGKNLLETYEVNGRKYTDNLPKNSFISIPKKQYIEYEQQKEEIERLNNIIKERENAINNARKYIQDNAYYSISSGTATLTLENEDFYELEEMLRIG